MYSYQSEITLEELEPLINRMGLVQLIINGKVLWDDETDDLMDYHCVFDEHKLCIVKEVTFTIVDHHHSIARITTSSGEED